MLNCFSPVTLRTVAHQAPLSTGYSRQEYWSGLLCPPPGDLPEPGIEPTTLSSPVLAGGGGCLPLAPPGKPPTLKQGSSQFCTAFRQVLIQRMRVSLESRPCCRPTGVGGSKRSQETFLFVSLCHPSSTGEWEAQ